MKYDEIPKVLRDVLGTHEVLRCLGFSADDVYVSLNPTPEVQAGEIGVFVVLKTQGREFSVTCGGWPEGDQDNLQQLWNRVIDAYNDGTLSEVDGYRIRDESPALLRAPELLLGLKVKGISIPDEEELNLAWARTQPN